MQICSAPAEGIPDVLIRTSSVSVKRDGKALNSDACHFHAFLPIDAQRRGERRASATGNGGTTLAARPFDLKLERDIIGPT